MHATTGILRSIFLPLITSLLLALTGQLPTYAVPVVELDAPVAVRLGTEFDVAVFATAVPPLDEVLAFGFGIAYPTHSLQLTRFSVGPGFNDDTALLGGPFGGSAFPGVAGERVLLGNVYFLALAMGTTTVSVGDQEDQPLTTGLFTAQQPDRYRISASTTINVVPDATATAGLLAIGLGMLRVLWLAAGHHLSERAKDCGPVPHRFWRLR